MEFWNLIIFVFISLVISILMYGVSYLIIFQKMDYEKISAYECGFHPFDDARNKFDVQFYLIGILFIIFDLEIMFLFPWAVVFLNLKFFGLLIMFYFLILLTIGFVYEWKRGALVWHNFMLLLKKKKNIF